MKFHSTTYVNTVLVNLPNGNSSFIHLNRLITYQKKMPPKPIALSHDSVGSLGLPERCFFSM